MLARTHGQTASPTTLGKEMAVFGQRLWRQKGQLTRLSLQGKINGAVGNYNAHYSAYPEVDWPALTRSFVESRLRLEFNPLTTQIENHDSVVEYAHQIKQINNIAIGLCRDVWGYISLGYFRQEKRESEVGSSTMPHKVNPIDFENAEGNFGLANALATHFADKLPISRFQRDLSDSTVLRSLGSMLGYTELACKSLRQGLSRIAVDKSRMDQDLDGAWEVLGEAVQTVMRRYGVSDAYERLKAATRGQVVTVAQIQQVIKNCEEIPEGAKTQLMKLTPASYTGIAAQLAQGFAKNWADKKRFDI
jgi:adenylosuccinate lyase